MDHSTVLIKKVTEVLEESLSIPMWGHTPLFPWQPFSELLQTTFDLSACMLQPLGAEWKEEKRVLEGLGDQPILLSLVMAPLSAPLFWAMPSSDVEKITKALLDKEKKQSFQGEDFQKGFFRFSMLRLLKTFDQLKSYPGLSPKLSSASLPQSNAYCIDVNIALEKEDLIGRLICPTEFHRVVTSHFASRPFSLEALDSSIELVLNIQVGSVQLSLSEWEEVEAGDLVILDQCTYHPATKQGSLFLTINKTPLFIARAKNNELKILDYALYEPKDDFMIDDTEDEEEMFEDEEESSPETETSTQEVLSAQEIPLSLCVELAHIKMSLKDLLHLKPGNTVRLPTSVEQGVSITLNSKTVARGELLQIGDVLGVKISEISH